MTDSELHDAIAANAPAKALADAGNDSGCAAAISAALPAVVSRRMADWSTIALAFTDPSEAYAVVQGLKTAGGANAAVGFWLDWLSPGAPGLDLSVTAVRSMLDSLATGGAITADEATAIKALAESAPIITADDVSRAWAQYRPDGKISA